jgi:hypothetical protein
MRSLTHWWRWPPLVWLLIWLMLSRRVLDADMARVEAEQFCYYLSGTFHGWCVWLWHNDCATTCRNEPSPQRPGNNYTSGACMNSPNRKCYCYEPCLKTPSGATTTTLAGGQWAGNGVRAHHWVDNTLWRCNVFLRCNIVLRATPSV